MTTFKHHHSRPIDVRLVGDFDHADFRDAAELIRSSAQCDNAVPGSPEVIIIAQTAPGQIRLRDVELLQRGYPLAGIVTIVGTWCEGEVRTGKPWPGIKRFYWYEFPAWWQQQQARWAAGLCPDWSRPTSDALRSPTNYQPLPATSNLHPGVVAIRTSDPYLIDALADTLREAGYATAWHRPERPAPVVRGITAGIWDGGQLDDLEASDLATFCHKLASESARVVTLLDFPRRDRFDLAQQLGAAAVLGKPWINSDLIATIEAASVDQRTRFSVQASRAA